MSPAPGQRLTKDNRKNPEYHVIVAIRRLRTEKNPQKNHGQTMLKISSISDPKRPTVPKIISSLNTMMQRIANENAAVYVGSVKDLIRQIRSLTGATQTGSIFACSPLHHYV